MTQAELIAYVRGLITTNGLNEITGEITGDVLEQIINVVWETFTHAASAECPLNFAGDINFGTAQSYPPFSKGDVLVNIEDAEPLPAWSNLYDCIIALVDGAETDSIGHGVTNSTWYYLPLGSAGAESMTAAEIRDALLTLSGIYRLNKSAIQGGEFSLNRRGSGDITSGAFQTGMTNILKGDFWIYDAGGMGGTDDITEGCWVVAMINAPGHFTYTDTSKWWILSFGGGTMTASEIKAALETLEDNNRLIKSAVRGADWAINIRGAGNLYDANYRALMTDRLKGDAWIMSGVAPPVGGDDAALKAGDIIVAWKDDAAMANFANTAEWYILRIGTLLNVMESVALAPDVFHVNYELIVSARDKSRELVGSGIIIDNSSAADWSILWDSRKVAELFTTAQNSIAGIVTKTSGFTLALTDAGQYIRYNSASEGICTVPPAQTINFPVNTVITIRQAGASSIQIVAGSGVTINGNANTAGQHKNIQLVKVDANIWDIIGGVE